MEEFVELLHLVPGMGIKWILLFGGASFTIE